MYVEGTHDISVVKVLQTDFLTDLFGLPWLDEDFAKIMMRVINRS